MGLGTSLWKEDYEFVRSLPSRDWFQSSHSVTSWEIIQLHQKKGYKEEITPHCV